MTQEDPIDNAVEQTKAHSVLYVILICLLLTQCVMCSTLMSIQVGVKAVYLETEEGKIWKEAQ